jgi:SAM-dependent methyltransferase
MAKIEIIREADEDSPRSVECLEARIWGTGGLTHQQFPIGAGVNFDASMNFWLEIRYSLQEIPLLYTRSILPYYDRRDSAILEERLEKFLNDEVPSFGLGDMFPETSIVLSRIKSSYTSPDEQTHQSIHYSLKIACDIGVVFGYTGPGMRMLEIALSSVNLEDGERFMRELIHEMNEAGLGHHPDPANLPTGYSDWPFARQLNRQAYDQIANTYQEKYFDNPLIGQAFDNWLADLPASGQILDAGCGHGDPVIARLLAKGFRVTGSDFSPAMLAHATEKYPGVQFWECAITEIQAESTFDAVCSFSSLLYLDPIDLFHAIHRLYHALKPGGLLFLYAYDLHPNWRGQPYHVDIDHWMWGETYSMDGTTQALEEHGYFKVLQKLDTTTDAEHQERLERWRIRTQKEHEELLKKLPPDFPVNPPDLSEPPGRLAYPYFVIAQKQDR